MPTGHALPGLRAATTRGWCPPMTTALPSTRPTSDEWRAWIIDVISYLNLVNGVTFMYEALPPGLVGRYYRRHHVVVLRIGAPLEDQAALLEDVLEELGLPNLFGPAPGTPWAPVLRLVPQPRDDDPKTWRQTVQLPAVPTSHSI